MRYEDSTEHHMNLEISEERLASCRNHIETLQNLRYLVSLEADQPQQVRLHTRMMEWHLNNLAEDLLHNE